MLDDEKSLAKRPTVEPERWALELGNKLGRVMRGALDSARAMTGQGRSSVSAEQLGAELRRTLERLVAAVDQHRASGYRALADDEQFWSALDRAYALRRRQIRAETRRASRSPSPTRARVISAAGPIDGRPKADRGPRRPHEDRRARLEASMSALSELLEEDGSASPTGRDGEPEES